MPLVWTAVDLTPSMIEAHNRFDKLKNDVITHMIPKESTNPRKSHTGRYKRNPGGSTRSRSVEPGLRVATENNEANLCDSSISSSSIAAGVSHSPESYRTKLKYDLIKGKATNREKHLHQNSSKCSTASQQLNSAYFPPTELKINTFFKQEPDRINDDELFRYVNEIHRQTLSINSRPSCTSNSGLNASSSAPNNSVSGNPDNCSSSFSNFSSSLSSAFIPTGGSVRRFKTFSNISLHLRLRWATPQNLVTLLKSVDAKTGTCLSSDEVNDSVSSSVILLNPECLLYTGSIFRSDDELSLSKTNINCDVSSRIPNLIREVLELPSVDLMVPFTSYRNLLYVYPRSVSLPSLKKAPSRNLTVRVQLMYSDSTVTKVLPAIYGKSNSPRFISDAFTTVFYHNKTPEFYDEIKIQLPANLEEKHYLLFTFYHIVFGYSWLPLLEQGWLKDNDASLLVSVEKPSPALAMLKPDIKSINEKFCMDACKWVDAHRELFTVSTTVVSSVYMQNASLECLLSACHLNRINQTMQSFSNKAFVRQLFSYINEANLHQLVSFFAPLLDGFLRLLFSCIKNTISIKMKGSNLTENMEPNQPALIALELLIAFLNRITRNFPHLNDKHGRNQLLVSYLTGSHFLTTETALKHYFSGQPLFGLPLVADLIKAEEIDKSLLVNIILTELVRIYLFRTKLIDSKSSHTFFPSLWFLLELFIHLLAQDWYLTRKTNETKIILTLRENPCFLEDLTAFNTCLIEYMVRYVCSQHTEKSEDPNQWEPYRLVNRIFSFFLYDLFSFLPTEFILSEIANYWNNMDQLLSDKVLNQTLGDKLLKYFKLDLLQIVCSHKSFYQLNVDSLPVKCEQLLQRHQHLPTPNGSHPTRHEVKMRYIPLATIEPDFYGTDDSYHHPNNNSSIQLFTNETDGKSNNGNKHFLISLVIYELMTALKSDISELQNRAVHLLWSILLNNELDLSEKLSEDHSSFQSISDISQLAYFYVPILNIACDILPNFIKTWQLNRPQCNDTSLFKQRQECANDTTSEKLTTTSPNDLGSITRSSGRMRRMRRSTKASKFSETGSDINSTIKDSPSCRLPQSSDGLDDSSILHSQLDYVKAMKYCTMKRLLISIVWILKYLPDQLYHEWLRQASIKERNQLFLLIYLILDTFQTKPGEEKDSASQRDFLFPDHDNHLGCETAVNGYENGSNPYLSPVKLSNDRNSPNNHANKRFPRDPIINTKFFEVDDSMSNHNLNPNNSNKHPNQHCYSRPNILELESYFTKSNSFPLESYTNGTKSPSLRQDIPFLRRFDILNDIILVIYNSLDSSIEGLWQSDTAHGQPGLTLFTFYNYPFNFILPYKKSNNNDTNSNNSAFSNQCLISCIIRVMLYALSLHQSVTGYRRILLCLKRVISRFPSFLFEDNPEFCAVSCHHLLQLCTMKDPTVRDDAIATLYFLIKNYYTLTNSFFAKLFDGVIKSNNLLTKRLNKTYQRNNTSSLSISEFKTSLNDSLYQLRHLTSLDDDSNASTTLLNNNNRGTLFNSEKYVETLSLTSPSSLNNYDDDYNTTCMTTTANMVPAIPPISNNPNTSFSSQVHQLADNLKQLLNDALKLQDTINAIHRQKKLNDYQKQISNEDTLTVIDLLHSISHRSRSSPELRLYWLLQIAEKHYELSQFSEASQCLAHCTAIVAEHLINRNCSPPGLSTAGCADIADAVKNLNILEESCACGFPKTSVFDNFSCSTPVIIHDLAASFRPLDVSWHFTTPGFMALISWTAESFSKAGFYEIVPSLYSRLVSLLQSSNDYGRLAEIHGRIRDAYAVLNKTQNHKKMFNSYFRVGFHGSLFGELNGNDFIYREAPYTKLAEITHRLQTFYEGKFGQDKVVIIKDSNVVDQKQLDCDKAYLQITFVEPYLEDFELRRRTTEFDCNYALKRFVHSIPFTIDGQSHGSLSTQYKRKYILTTARCFPYMKTRLLVVSSESHTLTPIEVALEDVTRRVEQLDRVLATDPPDVKYLQMILQGCIGAVVNQGPIEMATTFLGPKENKPLKSLLPDYNTGFTTLDPNTHENVQNRLRITFQQFLIKSYEALCLNESLIGPDQAEYHKELEKNFTNVKRLLDPLIIIPRPSITNGDLVLRQNGGSKLKTVM
ncbi:unnamed protein product [Heterobilharzia americana]|nr:unnamed protein product [Heterobilharzia americana]